LLNRFPDRINILPFTEQAALVYAQKRFELEKAGTPIGNMDLLSVHSKVFARFTLAKITTQEDETCKNFCSPT